MNEKSPALRGFSYFWRMRLFKIICLLFFGGSQLNAQTSHLNRIVWLKNPNQSIESLLRDFETAYEIYGV